MVEVTLDPERGCERLEQDRLVWPTRPHHDSEFPDSRFPILDFRIPNSVWHMGNLEYRTMYSRLRGSRARAGAGGCNGVGHGVSYLGVLCK